MSSEVILWNLQLLPILLKFWISSWIFFTNMLKTSSSSVASWFSSSSVEKRASLIWIDLFDLLLTIFFPSTSRIQVLPSPCTFHDCKLRHLWSGIALRNLSIWLQIQLRQIGGEELKVCIPWQNLSPCLPFPSLSDLAFSTQASPRFLFSVFHLLISFTLRSDISCWHELTGASMSGNFWLRMLLTLFEGLKVWR